MTAKQLILALLLTPMLASCASLTAIVATEPAPATKVEVVRLLCARDKDGNFLFGPVGYSSQDTKLTIRFVQAHNDAWDAATEKGQLCGVKAVLGTTPFGGLKWGEVK